MRMKQILPYIILFVVTTLLAGGSIFVVAKLRPEIFGNVKKTKTTKPIVAEKKPESNIDSSLVQQAQDTVKRTDTTAQVQKKDAQPEEHSGASSAAWEDSTQFYKAQLDSQKVRVDRLLAMMNNNQEVEDTAKARERIQFAKLIDGMNPTGAAQILSSMKDEDVKRLLLTVKTKQASKILSVMDAKRVARLMND